MRVVQEHSSGWYFDEAERVIHNKRTGTRIDLRELDTSRAVLARVLHIGFSESQDSARGFTTALRQACAVVFGRSLREVYCSAGKRQQVNWDRRRSVS